MSIVVRYLFNVNFVFIKVKKISEIFPRFISLTFERVLFMYKICFYVPTTHAEEVKTAMFAVGAGKIGDYACCAWQVLGEGQFMPLEGSHSFIGEQGLLEKVSEYKIEMVCADEHIRAAIAALKKAHPYEEPAYQTWQIQEW